MAGEEPFQAALAALVSGKAGHGDGRAVMRDLAGHDLHPRRLARGGEMLQGDLHRRLDPLRAAAGEVDVAQARRQP